MSTLEQYALIGDCQSAALVSLDGSIDWPLPAALRFRSVFRRSSRQSESWAMEDRAAGHHAPDNAPLPTGTLILETQHETDEGTVLVLDFMPLDLSQKRSEESGKPRDEP